jgi:hypothetical protein
MTEPTFGIITQKKWAVQSGQFHDMDPGSKARDQGRPALESGPRCCLGATGTGSTRHRTDFSSSFSQKHFFESWGSKNLTLQLRHSRSPSSNCQ